MKKIILTLAMCLIFVSANALPLFPFFVDVAGNYNDGTPDELQKLNINCKYWQSPKFYSKITEADDFLNSVMPYSEYDIKRNESIINKDTRLITYESTMLNGCISTIYLVELPDKVFYIGYKEDLPTK